MQKNNSQLYPKKEIKALLLRLNTYDLTSNFQIYFFLSNIIPQLLKDSFLSEMVCNNDPLTVQQFEHNVLSPEFPGVVSSLNQLEASSLLREYLIFFL